MKKLNEILHHYTIGRLANELQRCPMKFKSPSPQRKRFILTGGILRAAFVGWNVIQSEQEKVEITGDWVRLSFLARWDYRKNVLPDI